MAEVAPKTSLHTALGSPNLPNYVPRPLCIERWDTPHSQSRSQDLSAHSPGKPQTAKVGSKTSPHIARGSAKWTNYMLECLKGQGYKEVPKQLGGGASPNSPQTSTHSGHKQSSNGVERATTTSEPKGPGTPSGEAEALKR